MPRFLCATLAAALLAAGCGGGSGPGAAGSGRDMTLRLDAAPAGVHAGIYLAASRGYDEAAGVFLKILPPGREPADLRLLDAGALRASGLVAVMAITRGRLLLAADRTTLDERRDDVRGAVEALQRGYEEAIVDPESAVAAMVAATGMDRQALATQLDRVAPQFKAGERTFGTLDPARLPRGSYDTSLVGATHR
jgi:ABC-type nitrate/sulfonate/bicarbonate transport system substrate-binding protein